MCNNWTINWGSRLTWARSWRWWCGDLRTQLNVVVVCQHFLRLWAQDSFWNGEEGKETASGRHLRRLVFEKRCRILKYTFSPEAILIYVTLKPSGKVRKTRLFSGFLSTDPLTFKKRSLKHMAWSYWEVLITLPLFYKHDITLILCDVF